MINRVQVLWYLNKDDLENYCLDFKPYKSHKLEGYEICEVDEDLIFDLCDRDPDRLQPVDYFKNRTEVENYLTDYITNEEYELAADSAELKDKINKAIETVEFSDEGYYISVGSGDVGGSENKIVHWYEALKKEYNSSSKDNMWVLMVTGYDPYDLKPSGKVLTYILADILNLHESYFDDIIPDKGLLEISEWNNILDEVYKKNKLYLGLYRAV